MRRWRRYLVLTVILIASCGGQVQPGDRVLAGGAGAVVHRVRFDDDRVTCYVVSTNGISCVRDAP